MTGKSSKQTICFALFVAATLIAATPILAATPISHIGMQADTYSNANPAFKGVEVAAVTPGGAADIGGLPTGVVIKTVNGVPTTSATQLDALVVLLKTQGRKKLWIEAFDSSSLPGSYSPAIFEVELSSTPRPTDVLDDAALLLDVEPRALRGEKFLYVRNVRGGLSLRRFDKIFQANGGSTARRIDLKTAAERAAGGTLKLLVLRGSSNTPHEISIPIPAGGVAPRQNYDRLLGLTATYQSSPTAGLKLDKAPDTGSPAAAAGLASGELITKANGIPVQSIDDLIELARYESSITLTLVPSATKTLTVSPVLSRSTVPMLGVSCDVMPGGSFKIRSVANSLLQESGCAAGDVILRIRTSGPFTPVSRFNWSALPNDFTLEYWSLADKRIKTLECSR